MQFEADPEPTCIYPRYLKGLYVIYILGTVGSSRHDLSLHGVQYKLQIFYHKIFYFIKTQATDSDQVHFDAELDPTFHFNYATDPNFTLKTPRIRILLSEV